MEQSCYKTSMHVQRSCQEGATHVKCPKCGKRCILTQGHGRHRIQVLAYVRAISIDSKFSFMCIYVHIYIYICYHTYVNIMCMCIYIYTRTYVNV